MPGIVVGVDGSAHARGALGWALEEGRIRGTTVRAITVLAVPQTLGWEIGVRDPYPESDVAGIEQQVRDQLSELNADGVDVSVDVVVGFPSQELVLAAEGADLVVVGRRGMGRLAKALLGSVSNFVVNNATCPVVVVRE